jgi:ketosteroid isomerase-like protein
MKSCVKNLVRSTSAGCVLLVAACLAVAAQQGSVAVDQSARVLSLENAWNQAEVTHDAKALNTLLAETFDFTDDDGRFMNKTQWLAHIRDGVDHYEQLSSSGMAVHLYGNVAVATGMYQDKITKKGKGVMHSGRFTDIWIQRNGEWKCVASQATLINY